MHIVNIQNVTKKKNPTLHGVLFSSTAMAFAGVGDALLYLVLPIYGSELGISAFWIGILLSINRFVRIPGNTLVTLLAFKLGYRKTMVLSSVASVVSTFSYGLGLGMGLFFFSRLIWGLTYSSLRISSLGYAAEAKSQVNFMFGLNAGIKTLGAVMALFFGPIIIKWMDVSISFFLMSGLSLGAIIFSYYLPEIQLEKTKPSFRGTLKFNLINTITFLLAFTIDGILVVVISKLLVLDSTTDLLLAVGAYLLFRKICSTFFAVISGWLSDRFGVLNIFSGAISLVLSSLALIGFGFIEMGIATVFFFNSFIVAMLPSIALHLNKKESRLEVLTSVTTWWDIGAAAGTLMGLSLLELVGSRALFLSMLIPLIFMSFWFFIKLINVRLLSKQVERWMKSNKKVSFLYRKEKSKIETRNDADIISQYYCNKKDCS